MLSSRVSTNAIGIDKASTIHRSCRGTVHWAGCGFDASFDLAYDEDVAYGSFIDTVDSTPRSRLHARENSPSIAEAGIGGVLYNEGTMFGSNCAKVGVRHSGIAKNCHEVMSEARN